MGVASLIATNQLINVDMADVTSVMKGAGRGHIAIGRASGDGRAEAAADAALSSPLLDVKLERVTGCAYSVTGGSGLTLHEVHRIGERIKTTLVDDAQVIFGAAIDPTLPADEIVVTLIATGFAPPPKSEIGPIYDIYAYRPPQAPLRATENMTTYDDALQRYEEYLHARMAGHRAVSKAKRELEDEAKAAEAMEATRRVQEAKRKQREAAEAAERAKAQQARMDAKRREVQQPRPRPADIAKIPPQGARIVRTQRAQEQADAEWGI